MSFFILTILCDSFTFSIISNDHLDTSIYKLQNAFFSGMEQICDRHEMEIVLVLEEMTTTKRTNKRNYYSSLLHFIEVDNF